MDNTDKQFTYYYYELMYERDIYSHATTITTTFGARSFEEAETKIKKWIEHQQWTGRIVSVKEIAKRLLTEEDLV